MSRSPSQKIQQAMALWQTMPTAKLNDFVEAYKTQYGETISVPGAFIAKRRAGLTRKSKKSNRQVEILNGSSRFINSPKTWVALARCVNS